jgi:TolA-binding protein
MPLTREAKEKEKKNDDEASNVSNNELKSVFTSLIHKLDSSMNSKLDKIQDKLDSVDESVKVLKKDLADLQTTIEDQDLRITELESLRVEKIDPQGERIRDLEETVKELNNYILYQENRCRKYNLLFYGIPKKDNENTEDVFLSFLEKELRMAPEDIQSIIIQNTHRVPKNPNNNYKPAAPEAIIVKFARIHDRNKVLASSRSVSLTRGMAVRTDLPNKLKKKRGELAHTAFLLRKNEHMKTRILETKDNVILQIRAKDDGKWKRYDG